MEAVAMAVMVTHMDHVAMTIVVMVVMEHLRKATMHQVDTDQGATGGDKFAVRLSNIVPARTRITYFNRNALSIFYFCDVIHNKMFEN